MDVGLTVFNDGRCEKGEELCEYEAGDWHCRTISRVQKWAFEPIMLNKSPSRIVLLQGAFKMQPLRTPCLTILDRFQNRLPWLQSIHYDFITVSTLKRLQRRGALRSELPSPPRFHTLATSTWPLLARNRSVASSMLPRSIVPSAGVTAPLKPGVKACATPGALLTKPFETAKPDERL